MPTAPPLSVSRYQLSGRVGSWSLGDVYRARDTETDDLVAVHLFTARAPADPNRVERLRAEFRAAQQCEHPNILRVLEFGVESEFGFVVAEWVDGTTLAKMIEAHARLPEETAVRIVAQIGQAIDYARKRNLASCLVTPADVMIRNDGMAKFVPFGAVPEAAPPPSPPPPPVPAWRVQPTYGAPPPPPKKPASAAVIVDPVHALATTFYAAVTGLTWEPPPPPPEPVPGGRKSRRAPKPPPRAAGLTDRTDRAIKRATDPDPAKRPASCADFLKLLRCRILASGGKMELRTVAPEEDDRRDYVRYAVGVGSNCTINTSLFDPPPSGEAPPDPQQEVWPLVVKDASAGGVGILLARRCEPGTELSIELATGPGRVPRSLPVRVVRVRRDNLGHWAHGCQFLTPLDEDELNALLSHLGRPDPA
jgi:serine/threonine protein kinase